MILPVTLLILELLIETQGGCPIVCKCTENTVDCVSKKLDRVPYFESLENNPMIIDLSGNEISIIDKDDFSFDMSDEVIEIFFNNSGLIEIEPQSFDELENLQELYFNDNLLTSLPEDFLIYNENMVLLDLSSNYFTEMPKIKSDSLEVLTIANNRISRIANDALETLPNLRILLLQQNNLKSVNPDVFNRRSKLFFIRIAYNPWFCNCKTIKLFDYLTERKFVDLTNDTVQCQTENKIFVDIYNEKGVTPEFIGQCDSSEDDEKTLWDVSIRNLEKEDDEEFLSEEQDEEEDEVEINDAYYTNFFIALMFCITIVLSLIIGAVFGSCITYKYMNRSMRQTESTKELVSKSEDNAVIYSFHT